MAQIFPGRYTATLDGDFVVFIIGMRVNHFRKVRTWWPAFVAMPKMIKWLEAHPQDGLLHYELHFRNPREPVVIQYWRSFEQLEAFSRASEPPHMGVWKWFRKAVGDDGTVGIWHETYKVRAGEFECIYGNMPLSGLAQAGSHTPVGSTTDRASQRIAA
jgi:hypothetical protein